MLKHIKIILWVSITVILCRLSYGIGNADKTIHSAHNVLIAQNQCRDHYDRLIFLIKADYEQKIQRLKQ